MVKHSLVTGVLELSGALTTDLDLDHVRLTLLLINFAVKITVLTVDFEMAFWSACSGQNQTIIIITVFFFFFFQGFIQLCDSRKIHYMTREFRDKLHLKTDIALITLRFVRYQFSHAI